MSKERILLIAGVWVALLPYMGFPYIIKNILFLISGLAVIYVSFIIYKEKRDEQKSTRTFENFSENMGFVENEQI